MPEARAPDTGERQTVLAPAFGLAYEYWISRRFALASSDDVENVDTVIQHGGSSRSRPRI